MREPEHQDHFGRAAAIPVVLAQEVARGERLVRPVSRDDGLLIKIT